MVCPMTQQYPAKQGQSNRETYTPLSHSDEGGRQCYFIL